MVFEMGLKRLCVSWCPSYCTAWIINGTWSVVSFVILVPKSRNFAFYAFQNFRSWYFVSETEDRECSVSHFNSFHDENGTILPSLLCKPTNVDNLRRWFRMKRSSSSSGFVSWFVLTLDRGTPPWIDPTGVCSAWLILTVQVQTLLWDRFSIFFFFFWTTLFAGPFSRSLLCCSDGPTVMWPAHQGRI